MVNRISTFDLINKVHFLLAPRMSLNLKKKVNSKILHTSRKHLDVNFVRQTPTYMSMYILNGRGDTGKSIKHIKTF